MQIKPITGLEAMQIIGWDRNHWQAGVNPYNILTDAQMRRLAGNAFSGFVFSPVFACLLAARGLSYSRED